jgi:hypothetical protein
MSREITVRLLILDDATVWCRQGGTMRQVPNLTYEDLEDVGDDAPKPKRKYTRRSPLPKTRVKKAKRAKKEKSGGGGRSAKESKPHRGGRDVDWNDGRARYERGETPNAVAAALRVTSSAVYLHAKNEGWKKPRQGGTVTAAPVKRLDPSRAPKHKGVPDGDHPVANGRRYCKECGHTSPAEHEKCIHCFEKFAT